MPSESLCAALVSLSQNHATALEKPGQILRDMWTRAESRQMISQLPADPPADPPADRCTSGLSRTTQLISGLLSKSKHVLVYVTEVL